MLELLKDIPVAAWVGISAPIVTGVFLTLQNGLNNRREDRRIAADLAEREADRKFQLQQAERARADARADVWRDERQAAHSALIAEIRKSHQRVRTMLLRLPLDGNFVGGDDAHDGQEILFDASGNEALTDALARVEVVGSQVARAAAAAASNQLTLMAFRSFSLDPRQTPERRASTAGHLKEEANKMKDRLDAYIDAVRVDLGTAD